LIGATDEEEEEEEEERTEEEEKERRNNKPDLQITIKVSVYHRRDCLFITSS
jgi:hypothetical protein